MADQATAAPVLSTPDTHILTETLPDAALYQADKLSDEQLTFRYEIERTITEIKRHRWERIALQFPDQMLPHSARVYQLLSKCCRQEPREHTGSEQSNPTNGISEPLVEGLRELSVAKSESVKFTILADTSYGSCCVDEIAAEHVEADAVIHYGRACLSPTARLPVLHIYTKIPLDLGEAVRSFEAAFLDPAAKVILTADVPFEAHVRPLTARLEEVGYSHVFAASIIHEPASSIPNRTVPLSVVDDPATLSEWSLFHISEPPTSFLLTLHSRMATIKVFSTERATDASAVDLEKSTSQLLRRRYALITSLATVPVWGILINTLSVKNYLSVLAHVQSVIAAAGKKSYLFVVGKLNAAKLANFSEIGGWVVIGCWESSLIDSREFFRPIITPFELEMALVGDERRVWTGEWRADFEKLLEEAPDRPNHVNAEIANDNHSQQEHDRELESDSTSEDEPPEFDLRTGKYVSRTRPMRKHRPAVQAVSDLNEVAKPSAALVKKANGDIALVNGIASPAAEFLAQKRTWQGLGSDFEVRYEDEQPRLGGVIEEGRTGIASRYTIGDETSRT